MTSFLDKTGLQHYYDKTKPEKVDVGRTPFDYDGVSLPAIYVNELNKIYQNSVNNRPQIMYWEFLETYDYLTLISVKKEYPKYYINVLVDNKYYCTYDWLEGDPVSKLVNPTVTEAGGVSGDKVVELDFTYNMMEYWDLEHLGPFVKTEWGSIRTAISDAIKDDEKYANGYPMYMYITTNLTNEDGHIISTENYFNKLVIRTFGAETSTFYDIRITRENDNNIYMFSYTSDSPDVVNVFSSMYITGSTTDDYRPYTTSVMYAQDLNGTGTHSMLNYKGDINSNVIRNVQYVELSYPVTPYFYNTVTYRVEPKFNTFDTNTYRYGTYYLISQNETLVYTFNGVDRYTYSSTISNELPYAHSTDIEELFIDTTGYTQQFSADWYYDWANPRPPIEGTINVQNIPMTAIIYANAGSNNNTKFILSVSGDSEVNCTYDDIVISIATFSTESGEEHKYSFGKSEIINGSLYVEKEIGLDLNSDNHNWTVTLLTKGGE